MFELINVFATKQFGSFWLPIFPLLIDCNELKIAQTAQINQLFQLLSLIFTYGDVTYGLTYMLLSENNVSEDSPIPYESLTQSTGPWML